MENKKYFIMRDREGALTPMSWIARSYTSKWAREIYSLSISKVFNIYQNGRILVLLFREDMEKVENYIAYRLVADNEYFLTIKKEIRRRELILRKLFQKLKQLNFQKQPDFNLLELAKEIMQKNIYYEAANVLAWAYASNRLEKIAKEILRLPAEDFLVLSTPKIKTALNQMEEDLHLKAKEVGEGKISLSVATKELADKYGWIPHGFDGMEYWKASEFENRICEALGKNPSQLENEVDKIQKNNQELEEKKKKIIQKYNINTADLLLIKKLNTLAVWTDERKGLTFQLYYFYHKILAEMANRKNLPVINLKYLLTEELEEFLIDPQKMNSLAQNRAKYGVRLDFEDGRYTIMSDADRKDLLKEIETTRKNEKLQGSVASRGGTDKYTGRVKVLLSPKESHKIEENDILVATMTTPDYVVAMKKAGAFVTDEGGVTCHAAIVAREMNKPCITGTGTATKTLRDEDKIALNLKNGEIEKLANSQ